MSKDRFPERAKTITIIGCGGFIGSHLCGRLLDATAMRVIGVDIASAKIEHLLGRERFVFTRADLHDLDSLRPLFKRSGTVVLLAALCNPALYNTKPLEVMDVNGLGTIPLVSLCAEIGARLVYFSTSEVYGRTAASLGCRKRGGFLLREDESPLIVGPVNAQRWSYACAKQLVERYIYACGRERKLAYTIVRPFNVIGPRMDFLPGIDGSGVPRVLACFVSALLRGTPLKLVDGGKSRRCFTYIDDAVDACLKIVARPGRTNGTIINLGNPANETTIAGLAALMVDLWRQLSPRTRAARYTIRSVPAAEFYGRGYEDCDRRMPDITRARRLLGWEPATGLRDALEKTLRWYHERYGQSATRAGT